MTINERLNRAIEPQNVGCYMAPNGEWVARVTWSKKRGLGRTPTAAIAALRPKLERELQNSTR